MYNQTVKHKYYVDGLCSLTDITQIIWPSFSRIWPGMVRISDFPFVRGTANVLIRPSAWKKHVYKEEEPAEL